MCPTPPFRSKSLAQEPSVGGGGGGTPRERHGYHHVGFPRVLEATAPAFPRKPDFRSEAEA